MIVVGVIVSLALLAVIIRFALSRQSDKPVKRAALIALALISLTIIVCLVIVITGPQATEEEAVFTGLPLAEQVAVVNSGRSYMLIVGIFMLLFVGLIIFLSLREEKKKRSAQGPVKPSG
ncbi:MAG: hypothetical protein LBG07_11905 [Treponema sp.]|nr:hypothetical protein [Treponema sp.]